MKRNLMELGGKGALIMTADCNVANAVTAIASPPFWRMIPAVASAAVPSRSTTTTRAPRCAKATEAARPIPLPPPVIRATFPVKSILLVPLV